MQMRTLTVRFLSSRTKHPAGQMNKQLLHGIAAAALATLLGWILLAISGDGGIFERLSYDLIFAARHAHVPEECVLVLMDETAHQDLNQKWGEMWERSLHAQLLERLTHDGARLVVFDVWLAQPGNEAADKLLAEAIRKNGKVVLAAELAQVVQPGIAKVFQVRRPIQEFAEAARGWGLAQVFKDADLGVRLMHPGTEDRASLPWVAAVLSGAPLTNTPAAWMQERWINYYGPANTLRWVNFAEALRQPAGFFTNKIVFIGGKPATRFVAEEVDEFRGPFTRWNGEFAGGVEIMATSFLNLLHHDWLERVSPWKESLLLLLCGGISGLGLVRFRPIIATMLSVGAILFVTMAALLIAWQFRVWFVWMLIVGVQIPCAWLGAIFSAVATVRSEVATSPSPGPAPGNALPVIPDHTLLRSIGSGAYGEVWLARNVFGLYRAVKIVHRKQRGGPEAYEREFNGIRKFMPVSLNHPGLLHILHVGCNDAAGYYYCVMEVGDDEVAGQKFDPGSYSARNLHRELSRRGALPIVQCIELGLALTEALEYLHSQQLIHRDIKPSNVIFVNNVPKLVDVGLVTEIDRSDMSVVGTPNFMDHQNPGTVVADLYALGKVLYMAVTGLGPADFPTLPTGWEQRPEVEDFMQFNEIITKACQPELNERYQIAAEMRAELASLRDHLHFESKPDA